MHYVHRGEPASRVKLTKRALDKKSERMEERGVRISETVYVHACTGVCVYTREREREREKETIVVPWMVESDRVELTEVELMVSDRIGLDRIE